MTATGLLINALQYYKIAIISNSSHIIGVVKDYVIEVEDNGLYKLMQHKQVIAPFDDLDELCLFILRD